MRPPFSRTLFDLLDEQAARYPDRVAVIHDQVSLTYPLLRDRALRVAGMLADRGVKRGDRIGMLVGNCPEWLEIVFGGAAVGATVVPFSTWSKPAEIEFLLRDSGVRVLFAVDRVGDQHFAADLAALVPEMRDARPGTWHSVSFPELDGVVMLGQHALAGALDWHTHCVTHPPLATLPAPGEGACAEDIALVLYTSGSTSYPKAVPLAHGRMIGNGFNIGERMGLQPHEPVLLPLPLFWSYGSANAMCATFTHGGTLVLQTRFEPGEALDLIEHHRVAAIYTLPAPTAAIVGHPSFHAGRTRSLRTGLTIGNANDVATAANVLGAREICNVYGQTESYGNCAVTWHHWPLERRQSVQGPPLPGARVRITHPGTGAVQPAGEVGSIEVAGSVTPGYDGTSREQNAKVFTADGWFRTGDLGRLTSEGDIQFVGRDNEMIKRAGINIAPAEVEALLQQHPAVALAGVSGAPDAERGEQVIAFIVTAPGASVSSDELRAHCRARASSYKTPDRFEFRTTLPTTTTGKLLRRELKQMAATLAGGG